MRGVSNFGGVVRLSVEDSKLRAQDHVEGVARNGAIHDVVKCFRNDSPVLVLNQGVAVAEVDRPAAGLAIVRQVAGAPALQGYYLLYADAERDFLEAKKLPETLRVWTNTYLG